MIRLSINLPTKRRLDLTLVKDRTREDETPLLPNMGKILRTQKGSKISRFFRHIFENKKIRRILGANFAIATIASSLFTTGNTDSLQDIEENVVSASLVLTTQKSVRYPLDHVNVTQEYKFYHPGVDYDGYTGEPVFAIVDGIVADIQYSSYGYGNAILVDHGNNIETLYAHLSKVYVLPGENVNKIEAIGTVGATGRASGDHLHLEIRENGYPIDPSLILP
jgi:murein DD-endopeptidase MepM/ murein hydrolase activator NlpD